MIEQETEKCMIKPIIYLLSITTFLSFSALGQTRSNNFSINNPLAVSSSSDFGNFVHISPSFEKSIGLKRSLRYSLPLLAGNKLRGIGGEVQHRWYKNASKKYEESDSNAYAKNPREYYRNRGLYFSISLKCYYQIHQYKSDRFTINEQLKYEDMFLSIPISVGKQWVWNNGVSLNIGGGIGPALHFFKSKDSEWDRPNHLPGYFLPNISVGFGYSF